MYKRRYSTTALKRKMLFGGLAILFLAALAVGVFFLFRAVLAIEPQIYDEFAVEGKPSVEEGKNGYTVVNNPDVCQLGLCLKAVADESRSRVGLYLYNPVESTGSVRVEAYEVIFSTDENGALSYAAGERLGGTYFVKPGQHVVYMELEDALDPDDFNGDQLPVLLKVSSRSMTDGTSNGTFFLRGAFYLDEASANK